MIDERLIHKLFNIHSMSDKEEGMIEFVSSYLKNIGVEFDVDELGNVYGFNHKNAPMLSAHLDTVQSESDKYLTKFIKIQGNILSGYSVIGGDDKCGVYIILKLLEDGEKVNFVFPTSEEIGGVGSEYFVNTLGDLVEATPYGIVLDRRGSSDIIGFRNDYCEYDFEKVVNNIGKGFGFSSNTGTFSDADAFSRATACINLSVGYYNPHTKYEFVKLDELKNSMDFVHAIVKNVHEKFKVPSKMSYTRKHGWTSGNQKYSSYDDLDDIYDIYDIYDDSESTFAECELCGTFKIKETMTHIDVIGGLVCNGCVERLRDEILYGDNMYENSDYYQYNEGYF